jgi:hypothetical protein
MGRADRAATQGEPVDVAQVWVRRSYLRGEHGIRKSRHSSRRVPLAEAVAGDHDRHYK